MERLKKIYAFRILVLGVFLVGCSSTPALKTDIEEITFGTKISKTIGVYYHADFRQYQKVVDPWGNYHKVIFSIGSESVELMEKLLPELFIKVVEVENTALSTADASGVEVILKPTIKDFKFYSQRSGSTCHWADATYEFTLYSRAGHQITRWSIKGTGVSEEKGSFDYNKMWADAAEKAILDAGSKFVNCFHEVPEAARWLRSLSLEKITANPNAQKLKRVSGKHGQEAIAVYDKIVSVQTLRDDNFGNDVRETNNKLRRIGLIAIGLEIRNLGTSPILIQRSDIQLLAEAGNAVGPIPTSFFAALAVNPFGKSEAMPKENAGAAYAAYFDWLMGPGNKAAKNNIFRVYKPHEFRDTKLIQTATSKGLLYFSLMPDNITKEPLKLLIPVIELNTATRYILEIPVSHLIV